MTRHPGTGAARTASISGSGMTLTAKAVGTSSDFSLSTNSWTTDTTGYFSSESFDLSSGSALTDGSGSSTGGSLASPIATYYIYDALGNLESVTEGAQTRTYTYDGLSRVTSASIPETTPTGGSQQTTYYSYSVSGSPCSGNPSAPCTMTDARGVTTTYTYDALNRVTQVSYNVGSTLVTSTSTVSYTYDYGGSSAYALGRLTSMSDGLGTGSETYTYDQIGRVTQLQKGASGVAYITNYLYNVASEPIKITYPSGRIVESAYNTIGQLCGVGQSVSGCTVTTPYASSFSYDAPGHVTGFTYGNGVTASLAYSTNRLQLSSLAYANGSTTLFSLNYYYTYNSSYCPTGTAGNNGQIQCIADNTPATGSNGRNAVYSYDPLGRLSTASTAGTSAYPAWGLSFAYDRYGNRPTQSILSGCTGLTCPTAHSLSAPAQTKSPARASAMMPTGTCSMTATTRCSTTPRAA